MIRSNTWDLSSISMCSSCLHWDLTVIKNYELLIQWSLLFLLSHYHCIVDHVDLCYFYSCQQSSALSLLSLFESSLQRLLIMPIYYILSVLISHNAHLLHTFCTHAIFIVVLAINDKKTSMRCLLNICQHSPPLALMATQAPTCIQTLLPDCFLPLWHQCQRRNMLPQSYCKTYSPCQLWASWKYTKYSISTLPDQVTD